jgi:hypothetical protein
MASKAMVAEQRARAKSTREVAKVKSGSCPYASTHGISAASPCGTAATDGVWSPSRQRVRCHAHVLATSASRLSSGYGGQVGPGSIS